LKPFTLTTALLLIPSLLFSATLSGTVKDKTNGQPLEGVRIKVSGKSFVTAKDGSFSFPDLSPGTHKIKFTRYGYASQSYEVTLGSDSLRFNVELTALPIRFPGITVTGERPEAVPTSQIRVPQEEAKSVPGVARDAFRVLQTLPGVATPTDFAGWLFVRGGDASENLYLMDSGEVPLPYHLLGVESVVNQNALGSLSFSSGGFSARYGDRLSAVVDIKNREPGEEQAKASVDLISASGTYDFRLTPGNAFLIAGRRNYLDLFLKKADIAGSTALPHFADILVKWTCRSGNHAFSLSELRTRDGVEVNMPLEDETPPETLLVHTESASNLLAFCWTYRKPGFEQALSAFLGNSREKFNAVVEDVEWHDRKIEQRLGLREEAILSPLPPAKLRVGLEVQGDKVDADRNRPENYLNFAGEILTFKKNASASLLSPYAEAEHTFGGFTAQAGQRLDYNTAANKRVLSPRVKVSKEISWGKLYLAWGRFAQFPSPEYIALGAKEAAEAKHYVLGWEKVRGPTTLRLESYYKPMDHLLSYRAGKGIGDEGWGRSTGIELFARMEREKGLSGWVSLALSRSQRVDLGDSVLTRFWADQPVIANVVLNYAFSSRTLLGLRYRGSSGPTSTPIVGRYYNAQEHEWGPVFGPRNSERLSSYQRLDLRGERKIRWLGLPLTLYGEVMNITNHQNLQGYVYTGHYSQRAPFYMIPRLPFFGLEASW